MEEAFVDDAVKDYDRSNDGKSHSKNDGIDWDEVKKNIKENWIPGLTVSLVSVPLSTALAISSGA